MKYTNILISSNFDRVFIFPFQQTGTDDFPDLSCQYLSSQKNYENLRNTYYTHSYTAFRVIMIRVYTASTDFTS